MFFFLVYITKHQVVITPDQEDIEHYFEVLERYNTGTASPEEVVFVERYMELLEHRAPVPQDFALRKDDIGKEIKNQLFNAINQETTRPVIHRVHFLRRYWLAAASVSLFIGLGGYIAYHNQQNTPQIVQQAPLDVLPGKTGAILTLSNGTQLLLDSLGNGVVATQAGANVSIQNGALAYDVNGKDAVSNTVTTPKGRLFEVVLSDGTRVWLNAASSLTYPVAFKGNERIVSITGEAYFEVAADVKRPFKVKVNEEAEVLVLGTSFNINAYYDESQVSTTLVNGAVKVQNGANGKVLKAGQQANIVVGSRDVVVTAANIDEVVAWKNGSFAFNGADIQVVMRQLARWYNIDVTYDGIPEGTFSGEIDRSLTLDQVLKGLAKTRIHYKIEKGNKVVIQP